MEVSCDRRENAGATAQCQGTRRLRFHAALRSSESLIAQDPASSLRCPGRERCRLPEGRIDCATPVLNRDTARCGGRQPCPMPAVRLRGPAPAHAGSLSGGDLRACPEIQAALNWLAGNGYSGAAAHFRRAFTFHNPMEREAAVTGARSYLIRQASRQTRPDV